MTRRKVVITGVGVVSALGNDLVTFGERLLAGESGVRLLHSTGAGQALDLCAASVNVDMDAHFSKIERLSLDRTSQMALIAAAQAVPNRAVLNGNVTGVFIGCAMGGSHQIEATYEALFLGGQTRVRPMTVINVMANAAAAHIAIKYGLEGSNLTFSNACSSSSVAIGEAMRAIRHGYLDAAVAGGTEALLVYGSLRGWQALGALAPSTTASAATTVCKPFARDRNGMVLGEGAGIFMLEAEEVALARGAEILAEVAGYGIHSDASHISHPHVTGQSHCMQAALDDANLASTCVDYINAHGTGTRAGDLSETQAIRAVFGGSPAVSSTKAAHGHAIGAAGAIELAACVCALRKQLLPPTLNLHQADDACDLDYVPLEARAASLRYVMSNSFAFGGSNASLILRQYPNA